MVTREFDVSVNNVKWSNSNYLINSASLDSMPTYPMDTTNQGYQGCEEAKVGSMAQTQPDGLAVRCRDLPETSEAGTSQYDWWLMTNFEAAEECSSKLLMALDYSRSPVGAFESFSESTSGGGLFVDEQQENLLEDGYQQFDILKEMDLIVRRMIGDRYSIDPSLEESLNYIVGVHQSLQAGVPQHCRMECLPVNDPAQCCWNAKFSEAQSSLKAAFQREITVCVNSYLKGYKKKIFMLPLHCTRVLSAWTEANYNKPYMPRNMVQNVATEWGLTVTQINHWLENWRIRQWNPIPDGQRARKGTKFPHMKEDSTQIRNWLLKEQRHPNQEEAELLSFGTRMTPNQILMYCCNFRKRNKSRFKNWRNLQIANVQ